MLTWDKVRDVLALCVIPLVLWGIRLETTLIDHENKIESLEKDVLLKEKMLEDKIKRVDSKVESTEESIQRVETAVQANSLSLARLGGKLESLDEKLDVIREILEKK